jgi:hypothetical protein
MTSTMRQEICNGDPPLTYHEKWSGKYTKEDVWNISGMLINDRYLQGGPNRQHTPGTADEALPRSATSYGKY